LAHAAFAAAASIPKTVTSSLPRRRRAWFVFGGNSFADYLSIMTYLMKY